MTLVEAVLRTSDHVSANQSGKLPARTIQCVLRSATAELGELAVEVDIECGTSYKTPSPDGVVGEALDTIIALVDLIHVYNPDFTEDDLVELAKVKLQKWATKTNSGEVDFK